MDEELDYLNSIMDEELDHMGEDLDCDDMEYVAGAWVSVYN